MESERNQYQHVNSHYLVMMRTEIHRMQNLTQDQITATDHRQYPPNLWVEYDISKTTAVIKQQEMFFNSWTLKHWLHTYTSSTQTAPRQHITIKGTISLPGFHRSQISVYTMSQSGKQVAFQSDLRWHWSGRIETGWSYALCIRTWLWPLQ